MDSGQLIQNLCIGWDILQQDLELSDCVSNTIERLKGKPGIIVGTAILRIGRQFLLEHLDRFLEKVLSKVRITEEEIGFRILWRLLQDLLKRSNGFLKLELGLVNDTEPLKNFRLIGKRRDGSYIGFLCPLEVLLVFKVPGLFEVVIQAH